MAFPNGGVLRGLSIALALILPAAGRAGHQPAASDQAVDHDVLLERMDAGPLHASQPVPDRVR